MVVAIGVLIVSGIKLWEAWQVYAEGNQHYEALADMVRIESGDSSDLEITKGDALVEIPNIRIDFEKLRSINEDTLAWLYCPDTVIDYPVMKAKGNGWYLDHLPDGTYNANGTLFLDENSQTDFSGKLSIVYGHNMKSRKMFGSLTDYKKQSYFDNHPYIYLYTAESGNYRIDLIYGAVVDVEEWQARAFMREENFDSLLSYASNKTTFISDFVLSDTDKFIVLSTCSYEFDGARYMVIGKLRPEYAKIGEKH